MEALNEIKSRINSITGTKQITQSMRTVSTTKAQRVREKMNTSRPFLKQVEEFTVIMSDNLPYGNHPFIKKREVKNSLVIVIGGDRGLCGGYNINIGKKASELIKRIGEPKIITVGAKARDYCRQRFKNKVIKSFTGISETPFFSDGKTISDIAVKMYENGEADEVYVVYTKFKTMLSLEPKAVRLLPFETNEVMNEAEIENENQENEKPKKRRVKCEVSGNTIFSRLVPFYMSTYIYGAILEASTCEQSARMTTMDSAVKNAEEMIDSMTLTYNQARQAAITQEIIEVVSGSF